MRKKLLRMSTNDMLDLYDRASRRGLCRLEDFLGEELDRRDNYGEYVSDSAYDATDDCYLYDRNNPLSPWAY